MVGAMFQCRCPNCQVIFDCSSSDFGNLHKCANCGLEFILDTPYLVRYNLPNIIEIQFLARNNIPFTEFAVPVMIDYGYYVPPLNSDKSGRVVITREILLEAKKEHISTGLMDYKYDDYSLNRYIILRILNQQEGSEKAKARINSGWPINNLEKRLYGDREKLAAAFIPLKEITPIENIIDLSLENDFVRLDITVNTK